MSEEGISNVTLTTPKRPTVRLTQNWQEGLRGSNSPVDKIQMYAMFTVCFRGMSSK